MGAVGAHWIIYLKTSNHNSATAGLSYFSLSFLPVSFLMLLTEHPRGGTKVARTVAPSARPCSRTSVPEVSSELESMGRTWPGARHPCCRPARGPLASRGGSSLVFRATGLPTPGQGTKRKLFVGDSYWPVTFGSIRMWGGYPLHPPEDRAPRPGSPRHPVESRCFGPRAEGRLESARGVSARGVGEFARPPQAVRRLLAGTCAQHRPQDMALPSSDLSRGWAQALSSFLGSGQSHRGNWQERQPRLFPVSPFREANDPSPRVPAVGLGLPKCPAVGLQGVLREGTLGEGILGV